MQGRIMKLQQSPINPGSQELILQLQALASGTYQLTVYKDNQRISGIRFIKQ
jgi:hypothetical protein